MSATQIYQQGSKALKKQNYAQASRDFEALNAIYPFGRYAEQSQRELISAYAADDKPAQALAAADRYIQVYPRGQYVAYAYFMKGEVNFKRGRSWLQNWFKTDRAERDLAGLAQAYRDYQQVVTLFPKSKYAQQSRQRITFIRHLFAKHQLEVAVFYQKHKAYVAAINRAQQVLKHYADTDDVPAALAVLARSYQALGNQAAADLAIRHLVTRYPSSKQAKQLSR